MKAIADGVVSNQATNIIEVYADIWCPFAHVGLRALRDRRRMLGRNDVVLLIRAWPLELINGAPLDPTTTAEHTVELRVQVAPKLFRHFDPGHFPTSTLPALALVAAGYSHSVRLGEAVSFALRDELFERGHDISQPDVLSLVASNYGIEVVQADRDAVLNDWREGQARGVKGSPHFFSGDTEVFCPSLDIARDPAGRLQIKRNSAALDAFLAECLGPLAASS